MRPLAPSLLNDFHVSLNDSLALCANTEGLWLFAPPTSEIRRQLHVRQLEALYEAAFLRIFAAWEGFLEAITVRWMAGYCCPSYVPSTPEGSRLCQTVEQASVRLSIEHGRARDYLLWYKPKTVEDRLKPHLLSSPLERLAVAEADWLTAVAAIRHDVAHRTPDSAARYRAAALYLTQRPALARPGQLLRQADIRDPLNQPKWILVFAERFRAHAVGLVA